MASKSTNQQALVFPLPRKGISTRSQNIKNDQNATTTRSKRKAEASPLKNDKIKRSALGNLTNAAVLAQEPAPPQKGNVWEAKKINYKIKTSIQQHQQKLQPKNSLPASKPQGTSNVNLTKPLTRAAARNAGIKPTAIITNLTTAVKPKGSYNVVSKPPTRRISNEFDRTEESLYMSALEDVTTDSIRQSIGDNSTLTKRQLTDSPREEDEDNENLAIENKENNHCRIPTPLKCIRPPAPEGVYDFDKANWNDPFQLSEYAMDIFEYLREREKEFIVVDYMNTQAHISRWMRSLLVDWMVEVQESFELNHESLYLAVKIVDLYLGKSIVTKERLQLLGAAALFISCKFDERIPPLIDDFLYVCDGAYTRRELIRMEKIIFKSINFDLGIPLSYRFLRRYARCEKVEMPVLTLARFILELSLMHYGTITLSDSKLACAAFFIALRMTNTPGWNKTLEYYSGYKLEEFADIVVLLNDGLHQKPKETLNTIRKKYSHKIFFEVAKKPLLTNEQLFRNTTYKYPADYINK